mgnify:CR=1 FL=1
MAVTYLLTDGVNDACSLGSKVTIPFGEDFTLRIIFRPSEESIGYHLGETGAFNNGLSLRYTIPTRAYFELSTSFHIIDYVNPIELGVTYDFEVKRILGVIDIVDTATQASVISSTVVDNNAFAFNQFFRWGNNNNYFAGGTRLIQLTSASNNHRWSADDSSIDAGAVILTDTVGSNSATGSGFPTDGSAWERDAPSGGVSVDDSSSNSSSISNNDSINYVGEFLISDSLNNSDSSANQDSISFASSVNISDAVNNSLTVANNDNIYLVGELVVNDLIVDSSSTASDDSIALAATIIVNDSLIDSISLAVNDSIQLSGAFNVIDQLINSASIANNDSISFSSTVVVSDQLSNSGSVSNNDSVSFIGSVVISDQLTNSLSLANVDLISFAGEIIITDSAVNSSSSSGNDFIQIGAFEFTVYKETNISSIPKSRNINSPSLSTNIDG